MSLSLSLSLALALALALVLFLCVCVCVCVCWVCVRGKVTYKKGHKDLDGAIYDDPPTLTKTLIE